MNHHLLPPYLSLLQRSFLVSRGRTGTLGRWARWAVLGVCLALPAVQAQMAPSLQTGQDGPNARIEVLGAAFEPLGAVAAHQSRLVLYRQASQQSLPGVTAAFIEGRYHTSLVAGGFTALCLAPGQLQVGARQSWVGRTARDVYDAITQLELLPGQTHYMSVHVDGGRALFKPVSSAQALKEMASTRAQMHAVSRVIGAQECERPAQAQAQAQAPMPEQDEPFMLLADMAFEFGQSAMEGMTQQGKVALQTVLVQAKREFEQVQRVLVTGHADPLGSAPFNERLSLQRAQTVGQYLQSTGLTQGPIAVRGVGSSQLLVSDCPSAVSARSVACNGPNRRVVIELFGQRR
ncbi:OmpA family protein [Limnohabitans sp. Bal53]|uniref:OmpA family protein n=1 Tax=Limnohabitans sp. Bal53 TaxID=1977910 RepID=UPI001304CE8D|nr:OmpA family protein [Limnohabitans sp. Bal53]